MKRIDLFLMGETQYGVLNHFTKKLHEAFIRKSVPARLVPVTEGSVALDWRDLPSLTLCFNGVPSSDKGLLCDQIGVPHLALLVDPPTQFAELTQSPHMLIGCDDRSGVRILEQMQFQKSFFFPHAVEQDLPFDPEAERIYDVTFLASYIDYESIRKNWQAKYPKNISDAMNEATAIAFSDSPISFIEALMQSIQEHVPESQGQNLYQNPYILDLCTQLELYIKGKERVQIVKSITEPRLHIFGNGWQSAMNGQKNVTIHPPLSFDDALKVMNQSKVILNSSIKNKEGAHERIFSGMASEALVATSDNAYIREQFVNNKDLLLFQHTNLEALNNKLMEYLNNNEEKRAAIAKSGHTKVMTHHTWDQRVDELLQNLN